MIIERVWAMPTGNTFECKPIRELVIDYLSNSQVSVDPFAGFNPLTTYTNDMNPNSPAHNHMEAKVFLQMLLDKGIQADLILFDPPYSLRQIKECYNGIGKNISGLEGGWLEEKLLVNDLLANGGYVLTFGWNSIGMGKKRLYYLERILLVCHGRMHNDTICTVERKRGKQYQMSME